jgi:glycosyltransferase involved in cell wall biosynthesis
MIHIGIDGNEANVENRVGIGEYAFQLLTYFEKISLENTQIKFCIYLKHQPSSDLPSVREGWRYEIIKPEKLWTQIGLPLYLYLHPKALDIFFSPTHYAPRFSPIPTVVSVMDVSYLHFPETFAKKDLYQLETWTKYSVKNAAKVFTISEASKNDIMKFYQKKSDDVVVTHLGIKDIDADKRTKSMEEIHKKYNLSKNYFLFVGTLQPRKNITRLIEAFSLLKKKNPEIELVIVGRKGWKYDDILAAPEKYEVKESVLFLDFVPDEDLPSLYGNALAYILPSLYEGFGLPVLEAMKYDCPVITSDCSSLPEAGGDAALYVNPEDVKDIAEKMETIANNNDLRQELIKKGHEQVKKFSWEKTAQETLAVLETVAQNK